MKPEDTPPNPPETPLPAPAPEENPPPAASVVAEGQLSESDAGELVRLRHRMRDLEFRASELEDENKRLKSVPVATPPEKRDWLKGATFFSSNE